MQLLNNKFFPISLSIIIVVIFFWQFLFKGLLPIPADTIVGLYHPYRDFYAKDYPRGIPFKNFLITDPVRQQYPWKKLSTDSLKKGELPLWNPYSFAGYPLLANFQSAMFYPLNIIFFILPFNLAWGFLILMETFLGSVFMFLYLYNLKLNKWASIIGSLVFSFCGFSIAWLEWGNILHTAIWLPLVLLSIDKIFNGSRTRWFFVFVFALISSFFAGHLQIFFYLFLTSGIYLLYRWIGRGGDKKLLLKFLVGYLLFVIITSVQWLPTLQLISESARSIDQSNWQKLGWFIPWQNILQFVVPDFFGNPTTLNYWGVFNYGEFIGYIGVAPLIFAVYALFFRKDKTVFLFGSFFFISLIFSLPTVFAKIPYILNIPFVSTSQPTRLLFIIDFSLAVLSALGLDLYMKDRKGMKYTLISFSLVYLFIWLAIFILGSQSQLKDNLLVAKSNLILPSLIFILVALLILINYLKINKKLRELLIILLISVSIFDLFRFGWKFTPFTNNRYLFPNTKVLDFLGRQNGQFRIMTADSRILTPNFSNIYKIESVEGYDPLYTQRYAELVVASERGKPDIKPPFGFDRIITPHNFNSPLINLLGVRYILSLYDISDRNLQKVFGEGETQVYENRNVLPRSFFVDRTIYARDKTDAMKILFKNIDKFGQNAVVEGYKDSDWSRGSVQILGYEENKIFLSTENKGEGFLVLTDTYYPSWHAKIDGKDSKIYLTDYDFRGIVVPKGSHKIEFYITLF